MRLVPQSTDSPGGIRSLRLSEVPTLIRLTVGLAVMTIVQPFVSLPTLMHIVDTKPSRMSRSEVDIDRLVALTKGLLRFTHGNRYCVKQSLLLFRHLRRNDENVSLLFGIAKHGAELAGHAWVEIDGHAIAEQNEPRQSFKVTFSYPTR